MGILDFMKKKSTPSIGITVHEASREELEAQRKVQAKETTRNFLKDAAGLYPHEILLLSYYEKYSEGKPIARFWEFEFGIDDVPGLMRSLERRGFAKDGKLTVLGQEEVKRGEYITYLRRHKFYDISLSEISILVNKHPNTNYRDLIWGEFNRLSLKYMQNRQYGYYRNVRYEMYRFLMDEKRYTNAFPLLAETLFYDLNGSASPLVPPGIIQDIRKISQKLDKTDSQMIAQLQEEYKDMFAPNKNFTHDEVTCIFTAYAFGNDEIAKEILDRHNTKIM